MKIRRAFISNSSSTSFIVIDASDGYEIPNFEEHLRVGIDIKGESKFGWDFNTYDDIGSRINFAYLQTQDVNSSEWLNMLEEVIKENTNVETITWHIDGYIDHASAAHEDQNIEMFQNKQALRDFLFGKGSYIETSNDNDGYY